MTRPSPDTIRLTFHTQRPREDGCGVFVLQMLTGKDFDALAGMIDWGEEAVYHTKWSDLTKVLTSLGWTQHGPYAINTWDDVEGLAIAHVYDDHFMIYDADQSVFYDPWEWTGPSTQSTRLPLSYLRVEPPRT